MHFEKPNFSAARAAAVKAHTPAVTESDILKVEVSDSKLIRIPIERWMRKIKSKLDSSAQPTSTSIKRDAEDPLAILSSYATNDTLSQEQKLRKSAAVRENSKQSYLRAEAAIETDKGEL